MNFSIIKSRTFWTAAVVTIYNVATALGTIYPAPWLATLVNVLGLVLVTYFHVNPSQSYNAPTNTVTSL